MGLQKFKDSLTAAQPANSLPFLLKALWYDAKGDWDKAHNVADGPPGKEAAWVNLDLSNLTRGIYLVRFKSVDVNVVKKIVLE